MPNWVPTADAKPPGGYIRPSSWLKPAGSLTLGNNHCCGFFFARWFLWLKSGSIKTEEPSQHLPTKLSFTLDLNL